MQFVIIGEVTAVALRVTHVLETSHLPYPSSTIAREDVRIERFAPTARQTVCDFKVAARYFPITTNVVAVQSTAWVDTIPKPDCEAIRNGIVVYPRTADTCFVDVEREIAQFGDFAALWNLQTAGRSRVG